MTDDTPTTEPWDTAPRDGSRIMVQFPDGTPAEARWNAETSEWQVWRPGKWVSMRYEHGSREPLVWWHRPAPAGPED